MSYISRMTALPVALLMSGLSFLVSGILLSSDIMFIGGLIMNTLGFLFIPKVTRENKKRKQIMEIVIVPKQVSVSEISAETGLDREEVREVIRDLLLCYAIFGHLEEDIFIRDPSGRPPYSD